MNINIGKEVLTFADIQIEKINFTAIKVVFSLRDVNIESVSVSQKISFGGKTVNTLLVTSMMIIKLSHYIQASKNYSVCKN